ncbi:vegetative cell wall protein gp1-like [Cricetulus griseus]|uniref:Vegetative cell wall protein gp1-like n=1 Tax=Cricetulus griseus TaxID=10029 RepID=A0A9J7K3N6_CRIGR|nr:vegetative cell wall protein gp1-like [Cricetulus griseus]
MPFQSPRRLPDLNSPSGSVFEREEETVACPPARGDSTRAPPSPAPSPCQAHELLPASTVPPAPGRQLPRRPPLHQSPTSAPGRGHARLPPAPARPPPGARQQAEEAPAGEGVRGRVGTRTHQVQGRMLSCNIFEVTEKRLRGTAGWALSCAQMKRIAGMVPATHQLEGACTNLFPIILLQCHVS